MSESQKSRCKFCPEIATANAPHSVEHVVMIAPINPEKNKTQDIAEKTGQSREQRGEASAMRHFQFQNHDGDNDCEDAVAKGFEPVLTHVELPANHEVAKSEIAVGYSRGR